MLGETTLKLGHHTLRFKLSGANIAAKLFKATQSFIGLDWLSVVDLPAPNADDIVIADFEGETYGDWNATGAAFGPGPARGTPLIIQE